MVNVKRMVMTNLKCSDCGNVTNIPRFKGEWRKKGHIKTLWCFKCKKDTQHRDFINEYDVFGAFALTKDEIDELPTDI